MSSIRIGAVTYLNARPLVYGLEQEPRFTVRFDLPARCADLLHGGETDLGLIPSIEFQRGPDGPRSYRIVPDLAIASNGPVASVALFATREMRDVRSIALDTSSRTSVALTRVMCDRVFNISPALDDQGPDLASMLSSADAALVIGDKALMLGDGPLEIGTGSSRRTVFVQKIDLGELWTRSTGLPFVYAFWAGRPGAVGRDDVRVLRSARNNAMEHLAEIAGLYYPDDPQKQALAEAYLRNNIRYRLGPEEQAGLERFYRYAAEAGVIADAAAPLFFQDVELSADSLPGCVTQ